MLYQKHYDIALELKERCLEFDFLAYDEEIRDDYEYSFVDLIDEKILTIDEAKFGAELLYCLYQTSESTLEIGQQFYDYFSRRPCQKVHLSDLYGIGPEPLKNFDQFLTEWIQGLKENNTPLAKHLLKEALQLSPQYVSGAQYFAMAQETVDSHPELYLEAMKLYQNEGELEQALKAGLDGINRITRMDKTRSQVAEEVSQLANRLGDKSVWHQAQFARFYSDPTVDHLLLLLKINLSSVERQQLLNFIQTNKQIDAIELLLFFMAQFDQVFQKVSQDHAKLGWRGREKGTIIPLFLLLLGKDIPSKAGHELFADVAYNLSSRDLTSIEKDFYDWKQTVTLTQAQKDTYLKWCKKEVKARADAMIITKFRQHYGRMAALVVSLGEAEESCGITSAREKTIANYRKKHSRKSNFKAELDRLT